MNMPHRPRYYFGYGLSYTTFTYSDLHISMGNEKAADTVQISCAVENTGSCEGDEVVQLYLRDEYASLTRPVKELAGFKRIHLRKGEKKTVCFEVKTDQMAFLDIDMHWKVEKGRYAVEVGSSSEDIRLRGNYCVKENKWVACRSEIKRTEPDGFRTADTCTFCQGIRGDFFRIMAFNKLQHFSHAD